MVSPQGAGQTVGQNAASKRYHCRNSKISGKCNWAMTAADKGNNYRDDQKTNSDIENQGRTVIMDKVTDNLPSLAYSIGLCKRLEHPELISFGLTPDSLHSLCTKNIPQAYIRPKY